MRSPDMVAPMVCFLASDFAWNINGQIFAVQGGTVSLIHHPLPEKTIFKQGLWTLDNDNIGLREGIRRYFRSRNEDSIDND